jgi:hypothetical protein
MKKTSNFKLQTSEKDQAPSFKPEGLAAPTRRFGCWRLVLLWSLNFEV